MAEFDTAEIGYSLTIDGKYYNTLDIEGFSHMMKDPSYCYKFYWLEAIVQLIAEGVSDTTFDAVIDEMICNAWYSVREFHIHLSGMQVDGQIRDGLERAVNKLSELSSLPANASKVEIKNAIKEHAVELKSAKEQLTNVDAAVKAAHIENIEKKYKHSPREKNCTEENEKKLHYTEKDSLDIKNEEAVSENSHSEQSAGEEKICPRCGSKLVLRTAKRGNNAGNQFLGCSGFPKCRYIEGI